MQKLKLFIPQAEIHYRIKLLAERINKDYENKELVVIGILNGAVYFTTDLTRLLTVEHELHFLTVSSYGLGKVSGSATIDNSNLKDSITGKDILILEDMLDTGNSMKTILLYLESLNPKSVKIASLLYKSKSVVKPNYFCFEVFTDNWLIGYGLDDKLKKRNLTDIFEIIN